MYSKEQYEKAFQLSKSGFTYPEIANKLNVTYGAVYGWLKLGQIPRGRFLNSNSDKLSPELGYILGVIHGDGYVIIKKTNTKGHVGLEVIDKDFAKTFHDQLEKWSGLKHHFSFNKNKKLYTVKLHSLRAATFLKKFNIFDLINAGNKIKANFLKGMFDSEGSVSGSNLKTPRRATRFVALYNTDEQLILLVKTLLESLGIKVQNIDRRIKSGFTDYTIELRLRIGGMNNLKMFKDKVGFFIERKNKKLNEILGSYGKNRKSIYYYSTSPVVEQI